MFKELIKEALIETLREVDSDPQAPTGNHHPLIGRDVVVRARNAGVHYGTLAETGDFITLKDSHRI